MKTGLGHPFPHSSTEPGGVNLRMDSETGKFPKQSQGVLRDPVPIPTKAPRRQGRSPKCDVGSVRHYTGGPQVNGSRPVQQIVQAKYGHRIDVWTAANSRGTPEKPRSGISILPC